MGLRRIPPNWWHRVRAGQLVGYAAFVSLSGVVGLVLSLISSTGTTLSWKVVVPIGLVCVAVGPLAAYFKGHRSLLPDAFVDEIGRDGGYHCAFCSPAKLKEACEWTKVPYGHEYVAPDIAARWQKKNQRAFVEISNSRGELCACFGIMALSDSFMDQFVKGNVSDTQLREDDVCGFEKSNKSKRLYISGVVVRDHQKNIGHKRACVMLWAMLIYVKRIYGLTRRELFAVAVTRESENLMKNLGFDLVSPARERKEKCNMYRYTVSKDSWKQLMHKIGDFSPMCECSFDKPKSTAR